MLIFRGTHNSDMTEGKGGPVTIGLYDNPEAAYEACKGQGVFGVGDGDVDVNVLQSFYDSTAGSRWVNIFGYHYDPITRKSSYGWHGGYEHLNLTHPGTR